jgi:hypothetical protein
MKPPAVLGNNGDMPGKADKEKNEVSKSILHQNKLKKKQDTTTGRAPVAVAMSVTGSQHLIPGVVAKVAGPFHALQDHVHHPQDITSRTRILQDSRDGR